jgi:hypothetical protein
MAVWEMRRPRLPLAPVKHHCCSPDRWNGLSRNVTLCRIWPSPQTRENPAAGISSSYSTFNAVTPRARKRRGYALTENVGLDEVVEIPRSLSTSLTVRPVAAFDRNYRLRMEN